jgi:predicted  nucleic acid-binding Zn-ribbon protein
LKLLYALQKVDIQLQEIQELKGDLPAIVAELDAKVSDLETRLKELEKVSKQAKIDRENADDEILGSAEKIEKYKSQQLQVKSNKQYDALTKEIEQTQERSIRLQKEMELLEGKITLAKTDSDALRAQLDEIMVDYDDRKKELKEVNKEHEKEELKYRHEREKIIARMDKEDLERYDRIQKAKGGTAVVPVKRGACGGCFSRVPPQKMLEIRQNARLFMCEHCGRILVSDQIAEKSPAM